MIGLASTLLLSLMIWGLAEVALVKVVTSSAFLLAICVFGGLLGCAVAGRALSHPKYEEEQGEKGGRQGGESSS